MVLGDIDAQTAELLLQFSGSGSRIVGQEKELFVVLVKEIDEFLCARQKLSTL